MTKIYSGFRAYALILTNRSKCRTKNFRYIYRRFSQGNKVVHPMQSG